MSRFAHLLFDLDGTLVDTRADLTAATNVVLATFGLPPLPLSQVAGYVGSGVRVLVERALGPASAHLVDRGVELFMDYYQAHLLDQTSAYAGIETFLAAAYRRGVRVSLLTNKPEAASRAILSGLGLAAFFGTVVGGDSLPVKKPDPQGVLYLQRLTGLSCADTLLIGDSAIDVATGRAAGVQMCGVTWGFGAEEFTALPPDFLVSTSEELARLVLD